MDAKMRDALNKMAQSLIGDLNEEDRKKILTNVIRKVTDDYVDAIHNLSCRLGLGAEFQMVLLVDDKVKYTVTVKPEEITEAEANDIKQKHYEEQEQ